MLSGAGAGNIQEGRNQLSTKGLQSVAENSNDTQEWVTSHTTLSSFWKNLAATLLKLFNTQPSVQDANTVNRVDDNSQQTNINAEDENGRTQSIWHTRLMSAVRSNNIPYMKTLLNTPGVDVNKADSGGNTALMFAVECGHDECVKVLIDAGVDVNKAGHLGGTALILAVEFGHVKCVKVLIDAGVDVNKADSFHNTALILAARFGHFECVEVLIDAGVDVNEVNIFRNTALILAARFGHVECVKMLCKARNIDLNTNRGGKTALMSAAWRGHVECVEVLCKARGIDLNIKERTGNTALMFAVECGHDECVKVLLDSAQGIDVNEVNIFGYTALMLATKGSSMPAHFNCIDALIKHPEAVIDVKTRQCILNLVRKSFCPEWLPYLKLTEGEAQDFMFKIKELMEKDKIIPEKYFILLINLFAYYPECLPYLNLTEDEAQDFMFKIKEFRLVPLKSIDNKISQEAIDKISQKALKTINANKRNKRKLQPLSFLAANKIMDMSHVQTRPDGSIDDEILQQYLELEEVIMDYLKFRLAYEAEQAASKPCEKLSENSKEQENLKKNTLSYSVFSAFNLLVQFLKRFIPSYVLAFENFQMVSEQTSVDKTQSQEEKRAILANKAKKAMKAKQTMSELFVKMQEASRLSVLKKMSFPSQLEAYIKILFIIHTNDVLKRNPFLGDAIKHTLLDRIFLREQAYNQD